ncbi:bifunctional folylpolyglutamate synthase/dihydrofolate synthase [bacterium]|nr:bifunctional folylpolyglutamate synthase/dihydrofolate synthase [bacterium]
MSKDYQKIEKLLTSQKKFHISLGLERILKILDLLGNPQKNLKIVQIAGTNGKGSTCRMLAEILHKSGYKTGIFTSPHIHVYNERIKIGEKQIENGVFFAYLENIDFLAQKHKIELTEFELLTAVAFKYFYDEKVEIALVETGLGGRYDATNVCNKNLFSIITSISKDHTERLGKTIEKIAFEKAGIIKQNCPVLINNTNKGRKIIEEVAKTLNAQVFYPNSKIKIVFENDINYAIINGKKLEFSLLGLYQKENLKLVIKACELLKNMGFEISKSAFEKSLQTVFWECRFEWYKDKSLIIDGAHNPSGTKLLRESLEHYFPHKKFIWIYGTLKNKDYVTNMKNLFKKNEKIFYFEFDERCLKFDEFLTLYPNGKNLKSIENIDDIGDANSIVVVAGSLYMPDRLRTCGYIN